MFQKIYFYLLIIFLNDYKVLNIFFLNKKLNILEKKIFLKFFKNINIEMNKHLSIFKTNKNTYIDFFIKKKFFMNENTKLIKSLVKKNNFLNYNTKFFYQKNDFEDINIFYKIFFIDYFKLNLNYNNKYYINFFYLKRKKISTLIESFLKQDFRKIINFIIESSFFNLKPILIGDLYLENEITIFNNYLNFNLKKNSNNYIFLINPNIKLKFIHEIKRLNLPIFSIIDDSINNINNNWIDYPIYIKSINNYNIYFFYCFYIIFFFLGQKIKKKYFLKLFNNFLKINFIKEYILKNELIY